MQTSRSSCRLSKSPAALGLSFVLGLLSGVSGEAATHYWTNVAGGSYSSQANWSPNQVPAGLEEVGFTNAAGYVLNVDVDATNLAAYFHAGSVTQAVTSSGWQLVNRWAVGELAGATSRVEMVQGLLVVTNAAGQAEVLVGRQGAGELALRGGELVADTLVATNGSLSRLTFAYGALTTLSSSTISNGVLTLGTDARGPFQWNLRGGAHRVLNYGSSGYGGLTLGGSTAQGRGIVRLEGTNCSLSVRGLDAYRSNRLEILDGAVFNTEVTQLGLGTGGSNNSVVISGPGSMWVNKSVLYFGMHGGGQSMLINNGGTLLTGIPLFSDAFYAYEQLGTRIIVEGSGSTFYCDGLARLGHSWSTSATPLDGLLLVTNQARLWVRRLEYGNTNINLGSMSRPGNLILVADGSLWIGSLRFGVGKLQVDAGSGTIDELLTIGGTNAQLVVRGSLLVGHHGALEAGDLRVGSSASSIGSLAADVRVGGWKLGVFAGDTGTATLTGGRVLVTNDAGNATLLVSGEGTGVLRITGGLVQADQLRMGARGSAIVNRAGTLRTSDCMGPASSVLIDGGTLELTQGSPTISAGTVTTTNATLCYRDTPDARLELEPGAPLHGVQRRGRTVLQLAQATNAPLASLLLRDGDPESWSALVLTGGRSRLQAGSLLVDANSMLAATNTMATVAGAFTNRGRLALHKSILRFDGPVVFGQDAVIEGSEGVAVFMGGLHLPANDIRVPPGVAIQASSITSDGGRLLLQGGGIIPNPDGSIPSGPISFQGGWLTYVDTAAAPLSMPAGGWEWLGLQLIRSTNAPVTSQTFATDGGGFERLMLGAGSAWRSRDLGVGAGGAVLLADASATIALDSGVFRVERGGLFRDDTGGLSHVGFSSGSAHARATVSGAGSEWLAPNGLSIGAAGPDNQLTVELGARVLALSATVGAGSNTNNILWLRGAGTRCVFTNGMSLAGSRSQLLMQEGAEFLGLRIMAAGSRALVSLSGDGTVAQCADQVALSGSGSQLLVRGGASLSASNLLFLSTSACWAEIAGVGSLVRLEGGMTVGDNSGSFVTNHAAIRSGGTLIARSVVVSNSSPGFAGISVEDGRLLVTNALGTGSLTINGSLLLNRASLRANTVIAANAKRGTLDFRAGQAGWENSDFAAGIPLRVGDGTNWASLSLLGGTNTCRGGVEIRQHAVLTGAGLVVGSLTNRGRLEPSTLTLQGNLLLAPTADLSFTLGSTPALSPSATLVVSSNATLGGTLSISMVPGALPLEGQEFVLLRSAALFSNFANAVSGQRLATADRLGSFRIDRTETTVTASGFQSEDMDGDGLQDAWALQYFGTSPLRPGSGPSDLGGDRDGDGITNRDEFLLGTDPTDAGSGFRVVLELSGAAGVALHFPFLPGRFYSAATSPDLMQWTETAIQNVRFDADGAAVWDDPAARDSAPRYYRVVVR